MSELLANLALGFSVAAHPYNIGFCLLGALVGTLVGVLPGIGTVATVAMLLPITFGLPPVGALIMLAGIYYGAQYGGSTTSVLVNIPGEATSVVTCLDGHQMARQGRAGAALSIAAIGSFFAGCVSTVLVAALGTPLTSLALLFGPAEYFSLMVLGLIFAVVLAKGSVLNAIAMILTGLLLSMVGSDLETGAGRMTFDIAELSDGIGFANVAMGVFGFAEIIRNLEMSQESRDIVQSKIKGLMPTRQDLIDSSGAIARGAAKGIGNPVFRRKGVLGGDPHRGPITFDLGEGPWGEDGAFGRPCFELTTRARETLVRGPTSFTFITEGAASALAQARAADATEVAAATGRRVGGDREAEGAVSAPLRGRAQADPGADRIALDHGNMRVGEGFWCAEDGYPG